MEEGKRHIVILKLTNNFVTVGQYDHGYLPLPVASVSCEQIEADWLQFFSAPIPLTKRQINKQMISKMIRKLR